MHRTRLAGSLSALCMAWAVGLAASLALAEDAPAAREFDARFIRMEVPKKLVTGQVFLAKVTMQNTGTAVWREARDITPPSLCSQDPDRNLTWGTNYFIMGQGITVEPGKEFTFTSHLRAPSTPGEYGFRWRISGKSGFLGEPTPSKTILVEQGPQTEEKPAPLPPPDDKGRQLVTFDAFEYLGSFKLPVSLGDSGSAYSEIGMALRRTKDGAKSLFLNYTHPKQTLFEIEIPEPVKIGQGVAAMNNPRMKNFWGSIAHGGSSPNCGIWWDEGKKTLYWSMYHGYWTGGDLPVLGACKLDDDGTVTYFGPWTVPNQRCHWDGVIQLPKDFAERYAGGRPMALGFGGYYSICAGCSRGPSLGAIFEPDPAKKEVNLVTLLAYRGEAKAPRDGDYFQAGVGGIWPGLPEGNKGYWTMEDWCRTGVFVDLPDRAGYIAFVKLGCGRLGYDYGAITSARSAQYWYFYNPDDLGQAAKGTRKPGDILPYSMAKESEAFIGLATGSCFDSAERKLYIVRMQAYPVGKEAHPLVHVYQAKP